VLDATRLPEVWKPVVGFEGWYDVSSHGNVRSWHSNKWGRRQTPRPIKPATQSDGRKAVFFVRPGDPKGYNFKVHVLVMEAHVGPRPAGMEICHNDGDASNNYVGNLRYDTHRANCADTLKHGRTPKGAKNGMNVLTPEVVLAIIADVDSGKYLQREVGDRHGVPRTTVSSITNGHTWSWLTGRVDKRQAIAA